MSRAPFWCKLWIEQNCDQLVVSLANMANYRYKEVVLPRSTSGISPLWSMLIAAKPWGNLLHHNIVHGGLSQTGACVTRMTLLTFLLRLRLPKTNTNLKLVTRWMVSSWLPHS